MTPLRQRFIDDLRLKNFSDGTIKVYVHAVEKFALFLGRSPDESTAEDVRAFMVHQLDRGLSRSYCVILRNALRHLYQDTLGRTDELKAVPRPKRERRLPVVLSRQEVQRLFAVMGNLKHKALFMVAYDAGLRLPEILNLRIEDIDSGRMVIRICQGKGKEDRYGRLSKGLLPRGFVRIRYYGFLANRHRNERLEKCRHLLGVTSVPTPTIPETQTLVEHSDRAPSPNTCPACGRQSLVIIDVVSPTRPLPPRRPHLLIHRRTHSICFDTS